MEIFERITVGPKVCGGKAYVRNLRFPVSHLLVLLAAGESRESILNAYPYLEPADIGAVLRYSAFVAEEGTISWVPIAGDEGGGASVSIGSAGGSCEWEPRALSAIRTS